MDNDGKVSQINAKLASAIMKTKNIKCKFLPFGFWYFFSKMNTGQVTYRACLCSVADNEYAIGGCQCVKLLGAALKKLGLGSCNKVFYCEWKSFISLLNTYTQWRVQVPYRDCIDIIPSSIKEKLNIPLAVVLISENTDSILFILLIYCVILVTNREIQK